MGVASRRSMWCWTATATDSCRHIHWLRRTPTGQLEVWGRWATPSSSPEENPQVPPSVGSVQRRPAVEVCSVTCSHCENFSNYKPVLTVPARWCYVSSAAQSERSLQILTATQFVVIKLRLSELKLKLSVKLVQKKPSVCVRPVSFTYWFPQCMLV